MRRRGIDATDSTSSQSNYISRLKDAQGNTLCIYIYSGILTMSQQPQRNYEGK